MLILSLGVMLFIFGNCFKYYDLYKQDLTDYYDQFKKYKNIDIPKYRGQIMGGSIFFKTPPYSSNPDFYSYEKTKEYYGYVKKLGKYIKILLIVIAINILCIGLCVIFKVT